MTVSLDKPVPGADDDGSAEADRCGLVVSGIADEEFGWRVTKDVKAVGVVVTIMIGGAGPIHVEVTSFGKSICRC